MLLFLLLIPILISGILILRKTTNLARMELILPVGSILGLTIFTFFLNALAFLIKGPPGIVTAYILTICLGLSLQKFLKSKDDSIELLHGRELILWLLSILGWGGLIFWKSTHALIGSDTNLYYSVAHSFIRGNFPPLTPWQPDLPLAYHLGASELLGAFYSLTGLNFQFLHLFFSTLFIICSVQIFIWIWGRNKDLLSFLLVNLAGLVAFVSFGFFYLLLPNFHIDLPNIHNFNELVIFLRNLPTVNQSIEVYGAPINLDALIYFIFHAFGLSIFLSIVAILIYYKQNNSLVTWAILSVGLSTLALVSESIFVATAPAVFVGVLLIEKTKGTLLKNLRLLTLLGVLTALIILFQGGIITSAVPPPKIKEKSIIIFPKKEDIKENFIAYHYYQEISKILPVKNEWLSFHWFHVGVDLLILVNILILVRLKTEFRKSILLLSLFIAGFTSLVAYNVLVPRFLVANGNRFLSFSFLTFSLVICLSLIHIIKSTKRDNFFKKILLTAFILWLFIPTIVPPLALLSKTRFGENKLIPIKEQPTTGVEWIRNNLSFNSRVAVLDVRAPHPSGMARVMVQAGVFAPVFSSKVRVYTIEASPEYLDMAYFLNPKALQELKISFLLIDSVFFKTLPDLRKAQLGQEIYFRKIFETGDRNENWEKIYEISDKYLKEGSEIERSFKEFTEILPKIGKIYIDNEENFDPSYLRRAIIFSLKDRDLYFLPQSGVYLNVEAYINQKYPAEGVNYNYLVLGPNIDPKTICNCEAEIIFRGLKDGIYVWKPEYLGSFEK